MMPREATLGGRLAALGFADTAGAERLLISELGLEVAGTDSAGTDSAGTDGAGADAELVAAIAAAPDPDLALAGLAALPGPPAGLLAALRADGRLRTRLTTVLGASPALADHLRRHPADWRLLAGPGGDQPQVTAENLLQAASSQHEGTSPADALRIAYRRGLLALAASDLTGAATLDDVMAGLADLAAAALQAALMLARAQLGPAAGQARLAVIAMGKCGARELNYASDVDVIFVADAGADADLRAATQLASTMIRICSDATAEGALFPVDPNLRPEGRNGPLVRTVTSHRAYYERWARTWEFQALLKARPVAGDAALGQDYLDAVTPFVWQAARREDFVAGAAAMRRRVIDNIPAKDADREIKLGPGGLRDIEFAVQLLQLVHGRADETLRGPGTLPALAALAAGGYVGRQARPR